MIPGRRWIDDVKAHGPAGVGRAFGLTFSERPAPGNLSPCPVCSAERRHPKRHDRRGAVGLTRDGGGWSCHECDARGDAVDLAARLAVGRVPERGDLAWRDVRAACAAHGLCEPDARDGALALVRRRPVPQVRPASLPDRLPADEVERAWSGCLDVTRDPAAVAWLRARGLSPERVEERSLARAWPVDATSPAWARCKRRSWTTATYRVIVPLFGATGRLESLHARALDGAAEPKAASPAGASTVGLVMADAGAVAMLQGEYRPTGLVIAEGVPDFLTWSTVWSDADESAPVVLGVIAGSWTVELATRVPSGLRVSVRTHRDGAGEGYADAICASLADRCEVYRFPFPAEAA